MTFIMPKYKSGDRVVLLEQRPEDGESICVVSAAWFLSGEWRYDLKIAESTHYGPDVVGDVYHGASEMRMRLANNTDRQMQ